MIFKWGRSASRTVTQSVTRGIPRRAWERSFDSAAIQQVRIPGTQTAWSVCVLPSPAWSTAFECDDHQQPVLDRRVAGDREHSG